MKFDIKESSDNKYMLIVIREILNDETVGYKVEKSELYELYSLLRNIFKNEEDK